MNKGKVIIIGDCGCEALGATKIIMSCGDVINVVRVDETNIEDRLKYLGYSNTAIRSLLNMESINQAKQSFEDLAKTLKSINLPIQDEPKSKYINNPRRNYKR